MPFSGKKLREARGDWTLSEAAKAIGEVTGTYIHTQQVWAWENNNAPGAGNLRALAQAYGCSIDDFFEDSPTPAAKGGGK